MLDQRKNEEIRSEEENRGKEEEEITVMVMSGKAEAIGSRKASRRRKATGNREAGKGGDSPEDHARAIRGQRKGNARAVGSWA